MKLEDFKEGIKVRTKMDLTFLSKGQITEVVNVDREGSWVSFKKEIGIFTTRFLEAFEPVQEISPELTKAIDYIKKHFGHNDYETLLSMHARGHVWREPQFKALNSISIEQLRELLGQQSVDSNKGADSMFGYYNQPQPKREPSKAVRKQMLVQDTDALLLDLHEAMQAGDTKQVETIKAQLAENQKELEGIA